LLSDAATVAQRRGQKLQWKIPKQTTMTGKSSAPYCQLTLATGNFPR
jgi:hypothetical protein